MAAVSLVAVVAAVAVADGSGVGRRPVRELTGSVKAIRHGDFARRVPQTTADELGELAAGFNGIAEALAEYRRSSVGELFAVKTTLEATLDASCRTRCWSSLRTGR